MFLRLPHAKEYRWCLTQPTELVIRKCLRAINVKPSIVLLPWRPEYSELFTSCFNNFRCCQAVAEFTLCGTLQRQITGTIRKSRTPQDNTNHMFFSAHIWGKFFEMLTEIIGLFSNTMYHIAHVLRTNCLLKHVIQGKIKGRIEVTRRQGRRREQLLDYLEERRWYCKLKEESPARFM